MYQKRAMLVILLSALTLVFNTANAAADLPLNKLKLPTGFEISVYTADVPNARAMAFGKNGTLFIGTAREGKVYAVVADKAGKTQAYTIAQGLQDPNGVAFRDNALYVGERSRILRFDNIEDNLPSPPKPVVVYDGFPKNAHHGLKVIRFGPDGMLYAPVGAPCNVCDPEADKFAVITRLKLGGQPEVYARGVRNSVGYDWHPETKELWFTDNGRDLLGNDTPPDELNHAPKKDMHFGFPFCHGADLADPQFGLSRKCQEFTPPAQKLDPHAAALGMRFYTGTQFPAEYRNRIFIAEHGSWNRDPKLGHRVSMVTLRDNRAIKYESFISGWLEGDNAWGRPVDVIVAPDGALLVSDDKAGAIYRVSYKK